MIRGLLSLCIVLLCAFAYTARAVDESLTPKERVEVFEKVWKEINENYYDPSFKGVNWQDIHTQYLPLVQAVKTDAEFFTLLNKMAGELHDAHTRVLTPALLANLQSQKRASPGFRLEEVEGKPVITSVVADSDAAHAGIEPGMIVTAIDGQPAADKIAELQKTTTASSSPRLDETRVYAASVGGLPGTTLKLGLQRADGSTFEASITRQLVSNGPRFSSRLLPSGAAYIAFNQFTPEITKAFKEALRGFRNAPGLIIDLRNNEGGSSQALYPLAATLYKSKILFLRSTSRTGRQLPDSPPLEVYVGESGGQLYSGPVIVLVGPRSGSTAELFAAAMQDTKRAVVIGSQSCGCAVGINNQRKLKGGGVLEISEVLWLTPSRRKIEGEGVVPDRVVVPTISDLQNKHDSAVEAAEKLFQQHTTGSYQRILPSPQIDGRQDLHD